jgi:hypothetical protein
MPAGDRTGPIGQGPVTGRRLGYCAGFDSPGFTKGPGGGMGRGFSSGRGMRFGRGMARGRGFGRRWGFNTPLQGNPGMPSVSKEDEIRLLKSEADALEHSQKDIMKRLSDLEKEKE